MRKSVLILAAAASVSAATSAQATINLLSNPGFENGVALPTGEVNLAAGDTTSITGWTVLGAGVHYVNNTIWDAAQASRSIELLGSNGGIGQRVYGFIKGKTYTLKYALSADPANTATGPVDVYHTVSVTGGLASTTPYTFMPTFNTASSMLYSIQEYTFVASNTFQDLQFRASGRNRGGFGPVIDSISITAIPEASTWAMLVLGFGLVGVASRRRKQAAVAA
jgi:Protein of unknown function (DUF642)/PEP-CTERM motif